mgnify:CR=1 FL=1
MPSTLTAGGKDGKQSKKIERNPLQAICSEILLRGTLGIVRLLARGLSDAQLKVSAPAVGGGAILKASTGKQGVGNERVRLEAIQRIATAGP